MTMIASQTSVLVTHPLVQLVHVFTAFFQIAAEMASARQVVVNIAALVLQTVHLLLIVMSWMEEVIILLLRMESFYEIEADLSFGVTEGTYCGKNIHKSWFI